MGHTVGQYHMDLAEDHHHEHLVEYLSSEFPTLKRKVGSVHLLCFTYNAYLVRCLDRPCTCLSEILFMMYFDVLIPFCAGTSTTTDYVSQRVVYIWWPGLLALMSSCMYCIVQNVLGCLSRPDICNRLSVINYQPCDVIMAATSS